MSDREAADRAAIFRLHERDVAAAKAQDLVTLRSLLDDGAVVLASGAKPIRGRAEIDASFARRSDSALEVEIVGYRFGWEELEMLGQHAIEWGRIVGAFREPGASEPQAAEYNVLRVLRRQPDGEWKVYRTIWNNAPKSELT